MSITQIDYFLMELKSLASEINNSTSEYFTDDDGIVLLVCQCLENILRLGIKQQRRLFSSDRTDYWNMLERIVNTSKINGYQIDYYYEIIVNEAHSSKRVKTNIGRGRLLLRHLLKHKMLHVPLEFMSRYRPHFASFYDGNNSVLVDENKTQLLCSLASEIDKRTFRIDLTNADFLDDTWELPKLVETTYVPSRQLGVCLRIMNDHYIVEAVDPNGVVGEDDRIETGDVLTQLFEKPLRGYPGMLKNILASHKLRPITLKVAKARRNGNQFYRPILELLNQFGLSEILSSKRNMHAELYRKCLALDKESSEQTLVPTGGGPEPTSLSESLRFRYVGQYAVGSVGTVEQISVGIGNVLLQERGRCEFRPVRFHFAELSLVVTELDPKTQQLKEEPLFNHVYPRIASCGRRTDLPKYFGYIVGETTCCLSKSFVCLVFEALSAGDAEAIVNSIAHGFDRTHWAL